MTNKNMKTMLILALLFCWSFTIRAQFSDDFSDGDFTQNPSWTGTSADFKVNDDEQLQLDTEGAGESWLSTSSSMMAGMEWRFWAKLSFSPSSNNNARVYLASDQQNLKNPLNGYFVELGESGSDDAIELFKRKGEDTLSVCRGPGGMIASSFEVRIRVIHEQDGSWKIFADPSGQHNFMLLAEGFDDEFDTAGYTGVFCKYTSSNSSKFYFDDFYAGPVQIDSIAPEIEGIRLISGREIAISFSEGVSKSSAENPGNYHLQASGTSPQSATQDEDDPARVNILFEAAFESETTYQLLVDNIEDYAGNMAGQLSAGFVYYEAHPFDVVINEIMADPSPAVGLPEYEYLELFNLTDYDIDLGGWRLSIGNTIKEFENIWIPAGDYLILAKDDAEAELSTFGNFYGFSSLSLTNSGQNLMLRNKQGLLMSAVSYKNSWYEDPLKEEGGWALEQLNPYNPCEAKSNWRASRDLRGGTPGKENSVFDLSFYYPSIAGVAVINERSFELLFDQIMDSLSLVNTSAYEIDQGMGEPQSVYVSSDNNSSVILVYEDELQPGRIYELQIKDTLFNCAGNALSGNTTQIGLPAAIEKHDIVINEILFNPLGDGTDYLEIYNRSDKILNLQELNLASVRESYPNPPDTSTKRVSLKNHLFFPGNYLLLTEDPDGVKTQYFTTAPDAFLEVPSFPSYNNDAGKVLLSDQDGNLIDRLDYDEDMHYELLNFYDGVALERVHYNRPSHDRTNWHSAAEYVGYGTPAYKNSQFAEEVDMEDPIRVEPEIFSPDNDGYNDLVNIHFDFDREGFTASITIYDASGNKVRELVNNKLIGTSGFFSWNGFNDQQELAAAGIYIIYFEVFNTGGIAESYRKTCVLAKKL
ncbi:MAG: lamin tail domain-containing protein [Bacteroidota bacterium]|nr:lamin tail domain-containing protein [Bacteroidota bacterium]